MEALDTVNRISVELAQVDEEIAIAFPREAINEAWASLMDSCLHWRTEVEDVQSVAARCVAEIAALSEWVGNKTESLLAELNELDQVVLNLEAPRVGPRVHKGEEYQAQVAEYQKRVEESEHRGLRLFDVVKQHFPEWLHHPALRDLQKSLVWKPFRDPKYYIGKERLQVESRHPVYLGTWNGQRKVLKQYPANFEKKVLREVAMLQRLASPLISEVTAVILDEADLYIEFPFYSNETLAKFAAKQAIPEKDLVMMIGELLSAVEHLHSHGIIHCDIKPENVFVTEDGHVRLGDFDISRTTEERGEWLATELRTKTQLGGTLRYAAPELLDGLKFVEKSNIKSDLYSLGVTLIETLVPPAPTEPRDRPVDISSAREKLGTGEVKLTLFRMASALIEKDPAKRPELRDLLKSTIFGELKFGASSNYPLYWESDDEFVHRKDVTGEMKDRIEQLFNDSSVWVDHKDVKKVQVGKKGDNFTRIVHGNDNQGLGHNGYSVLRVERLENRRLWNKFTEKRSEIASQVLKEQERSYSETPSSYAGMKMILIFPEWQSLENRIGGGLDGNEFYLFHGTSSGAIAHISGLDHRVANKGLFGYGLYFAENASKSDEYTGPGECVMLLCRVVLGQAWLHRSETEAPVLPTKTVPRRKLLRAPWMERFLL